MNPDLILEAEAFDRQILERMENGFLPDFRRMTPCPYFYNNVWRDPEYVKIYLIENFIKIRNVISKNIPKSNISDIRILEVGCGPGHVSLELARAGYSVTGIDISPRCIEVARQFARQDPHVGERGTLQYDVSDFFSIAQNGYDGILFFCSLHHFPDIQKVVDHAEALLNPQGLFLAFEPTRDRIDRRVATVVMLIETLLGACGAFYRSSEIPVREADFDKQIEEILKVLRMETETGEPVQSRFDNTAGFDSMAPTLRARFQVVHEEQGHSFFHGLIGGLRMEETEKNIQLAQFLKILDKYMCDLGMIPPTEFIFAGRKDGA